jgi:hypothetical protein
MFLKRHGGEVIEREENEERHFYIYTHRYIPHCSQIYITMSSFTLVSKHT